MALSTHITSHLVLTTSYRIPKEETESGVKPRFSDASAGASSAPQHPLARGTLSAPDGRASRCRADAHRLGRGGGRPAALAGRDLAPHWEAVRPQGSLAKDETWRWVPVKRGKPPLQLLTLTTQESA